MKGATTLVSAVTISIDKIINNKTIGKIHNFLLVFANPQNSLSNDMTGPNTDVRTGICL